MQPEGIIHRAGLGKLSHLEIGYLRLQAAVKAKRLLVRRVVGKKHPVDLFTKHLAAAEMWKRLGALGVTSEYGRSPGVLSI